MQLIPVLLVAAILPPASARAAGAPRPPAERRWAIHAGGGIAMATPAWTANTAFTEFAEPGVIGTEFVPRAGPVLEAGLWHGMSRRIGVALTVTRASRDTPGRFVAALPHPLYVDHARTATGDLPASPQRETAVHFGLVWSATRGGVTARLSGGPSYFLAEADLVFGLTYTHEYPYDVVRVTAIRTSPVRGDAVGGHAGLTLERRIAGRMALSAGARWSRATIPLARGAVPADGAGERSATVRAGGLTAGASIRLYF